MGLWSTDVRVVAVPIVFVKTQGEEERLSDCLFDCFTDALLFRKTLCCPYARHTYGAGAVVLVWLIVCGCVRSISCYAPIVPLPAWYFMLLRREASEVCTAPVKSVTLDFFTGVFIVGITIVSV